MADDAVIERFQALYADHHGAVYAYAVSRVGRQLADEVVSEVFLATVSSQGSGWAGTSASRRQATRNTSLTTSSASCLPTRLTA